MQPVPVFVVAILQALTLKPTVHPDLDAGTIYALMLSKMQQLQKENEPLYQYNHCMEVAIKITQESISEVLALYAFCHSL
jgi:hypothetical protein